MNIGIVGYGIVGRATHTGFLKDQPVAICDIGIEQYKNDIVGQDLIFVCLPTDSDQDIQILLDVCSKLYTNNPGAELIVRSTIPVRAIAQLNITVPNWSYCPEFLRERFWKEDCHMRPVLIGCDQTSLLESILEKDCVLVTKEQAAIIKLSVNSYNSLRVVFANHVYNLCNTASAEFDTTIQQVIHQIETNPQKYFDVNEELRGFGGKCLPKDLNLLISDFKNYDISQTLFTAIQNDNQLWPTHIRKT